MPAGDGNEIWELACSWKSLKSWRLCWEILSQTVLDFYQSATVRNASGKATSFGAMMRFTGGTTAVYSGIPPRVSSFSARGPDLTTGSFMSTPSTVPVADVLKPNVLAPGEAIWSAWSALSTTEVALFIGELCWTLRRVATLLKCPLGGHLANQLICKSLLMSNPKGWWFVTSQR